MVLNNTNTFQDRLSLLFSFIDQRTEKLQDESDGLKVNGHMPEQKEAEEVI